jgi:hypothetical protein
MYLISQYEDPYFCKDHLTMPKLVINIYTPLYESYL